MRYLLIMWLMLLPLSLFGQDYYDAPYERAQVGLVGGLDFSWQSGAYTTGDAQFDCCRFSGGNGIGRVAGVRSIVSLTPLTFLRAGVTFEQLNAIYPVEMEAYPVLTRENRVVFAQFEEELEISLDLFTVDMMIAYRVVPPGMYVAAGPSYSVFMSKHQTQTERLISPPDIEFVDGGRSHLLLDSEIEDLSSFLSLRLGAGAFVPLSQMFFANPEVLFTLPLNDVQEDGEWSVAGFTFTLGVLLVL
ncbi:MAG: hypothetical protein C0600_09330 [Ignavibacteria bacterium]|nr:MAG: hypothetical protein C0600_09330 [Ignavibacteria bacterium]